ncbi:branched-chain amino acid ABC transporter permease [Roseiarcus sp.]|uniref:branched-chain amino acid ABC transporter permease n=1 Tax=Roseiarcus sp. TaxID=1969460 RepID=UPI003F95997C
MSVQAPAVAADLTERNRKANIVAFAILVALIAIAPFVAYPFFIMQALCFALFACAFNLLIGYVNLLSLGHAMFLGIASYVCAHAAKVWGLEPVTAIALGALASAVLGLVTGALAIRSSGIYFAMITVAFSQMVYFFCVEAPFTHGEDGIQAVPQGKALGLFDLSNLWILYVFVAVVFLFGFLAIQRIVNSPFGEILKAIRENEPRVISLGYRATLYKLAAFTLSAAFAGLAGATKAIVAQNASLTDVAFAMSGEVVLMTLVGGMGTFYGPVLGALIVVTMQNYLAQFGEWVTVIQGVVFVACVLAFRRGIVGELAARARVSL